MGAIKEAIARYSLHVASKLQSTVRRLVVRVKAGKQVMADRGRNILEVGRAIKGDGAIKMEWLEKFVSRWMERNFLTARTLGEKNKIS